MKPIRKAVLVGLGVLGLQLASVSLAGAAEAPKPSPEEGKGSAVEKARAALARAQAYRKVEAYDKAQDEIIAALPNASDDQSLREEAIKLWRDIAQAKNVKNRTAQATQKRKNMAELDEARRLALEGKTAEAAAKASQVLGATTDPKVATRAQKILKENHPTFPGLWRVTRRDWFPAMGWLISLAEALLILGILYVVSWLVRKIWFFPKKDKWWLGVIDDKTATNAGDFVMTSFQRWREEQPSASAGLLRLGALQLPTLPAVETAGPEFDMGAALESLKLQIGPVSLVSIAKIFGSLRGWLNALRPTITGAVFPRGSEIVVHLVKRSANSNPAAISASAPEIGKAAESATYQMYYLIANQTKLSDAELNDKLRIGLEQLSQYISGRDPTQLQAAYEIFLGVIREEPTFDEAWLYEGVALDLLERHDEAISRFAFLAKNATDDALRRKAMYNEAVSRFRKYTAEDHTRAIAELDEIVGPDKSAQALAGSPIKAFAYAAKANAIAHRFLFWQTLLHQSHAKDPSEVVKRKKQSHQTIENWLKEVDDMITALQQVYENAKSCVTPKAPAKKKTAKQEGKDLDRWDALTCRQLCWAIKNAQGNAYLNCAIGFYKPPDLSPDAAGVRRKRLDKALTAFQECEVLLPAGVETLTNLATTLLSLSKREEARTYAERAIALNPNYEYAYYRLAQSWDEENRKDEAVKVLNRFPRAPQIPGFKDLFNRYYVEPKSA
jgi:tetratricopeptide (TPR) repeat protein